MVASIRREVRGEDIWSIRSSTSTLRGVQVTYEVFAQAQAHREVATESVHLSFSDLQSSPREMVVALFLACASDLDVGGREA